MASAYTTSQGTNFSDPHSMSTIQNSDSGTTVQLGSRSQARRRAPSPPPIKYVQLTERVKTFEGVYWPPQLKASADKVAKAGFYYLGPADRVKCGYCGGKLKKWQPKDCAIEEHVKHFPDCSFVKTIKKQTVELSKSVRSRTKTESCASSEEILLEMEKERKKLQLSSREEIVSKTLTRMGYKTAFIHAAFEQMRIKRAPISLRTLLPEVQELTKQNQFNSDTRTKFASDDEGQNSDAEDTEDVLDMDKSVAKLRLELDEVIREKDKLSDEITCKICLGNKVDTLFLPCRHFVTCQSCADRVKDCPICRQIILGTVDVFMC